MAKKFYIADTHFCHKNVLVFDSRPFTDIIEMRDRLIENWNSVVSDEDEVYVLGDFCWSKHESGWRPITKKLKGKKFLLRGNHDEATEDAMADFVQVADYLEVEDNGRTVFLSHYPIPFYKCSWNPNHFMLYGHVHNGRESLFLDELRETLVDTSDAYAHSKGQFYNAGCMRTYMNYTPRTLDEIVEAHKLTQGE
jgi:calcineurin-like phosphoesterase family protein